MYYYLKRTDCLRSVENKTVHRKLCKYSDTICILTENMVYCSQN